MKFLKKIIDKGKIKLYNMQVLFEGQLNIAELCKGSTADSDSVCLGSNPSSATKKPLMASAVGGFFLQEQDLVEKFCFFSCIVSFFVIYLLHE